MTSRNKRIIRTLIAETEWTPLSREATHRALNAADITGKSPALMYEQSRRGGVNALTQSALEAN